MPVRLAYRGHPHAHMHPPLPYLHDWELPEEPSPPPFTDIAVEVNLDSQHGSPGIVDVHCPKVRRRPFSTANHVNLLDVVSCWKGLSHAQATEISMWNCLLREALEEQLEGVVRAEVIRCIPSESPHLIERIFACGSRHLLPVDIWLLLHHMITAFYSMNAPIPPQASWFVSTGDLTGMVFNFLRTHDCFTGSTPFVEAAITCHRLRDGPQLVADVLWQTPALNFSALATRIRPGMEYMITPVHGSDVIGSDASFPQFPGEVEFSVRSKKLPLVWDPDTHRFRAIVPSSQLRKPGCISPTDGSRDTTYASHSYNFLLDLFGAPCKQETAETTFLAKSVLYFPGNVRHERTSRYCIRVDIDHSESPRRATDTWGSCNAERYTTRDPSPLPASSLVNAFGMENPSKPKSATENPRSPVFADHPAFKTQRLALDPFEHVDLESDTKPSRFAKRVDSVLGTTPTAFDNDKGGADELWLGDHLSALVNTTSACSGEVVRNATPNVNAASWTQKLANKTEAPAILTKSRAYEATESKVMPSLRKRGSVKRIVFHRQKQSDLQPRECPECPTPQCSDHPSSPGPGRLRSKAKKIRLMKGHKKPKEHEKASLQTFSPRSDVSEKAREIRANYEEFLEQKLAQKLAERLGVADCETGGDSEEEQRKAFESIFLEDSQSEGWATDTEMSSVRSRIP